MFVFLRNCCALFSCYLRFEIRPFVLLPTKGELPRDILLKLSLFFYSVYIDVSMVIKIYAKTGNWGPTSNGHGIKT